MNNKPTIVCLCGSTRFYEEFMIANYEETLAGKIVLSVGFFVNSSDVHGQNIGCTNEQKIALDKLHKRKIDLADEILVINKGGYIGESTRSEIEYAKKHNKVIRYYVDGLANKKSKFRKANLEFHKKRRCECADDLNFGEPQPDCSKCGGLGVIK